MKSTLIDLTNQTFGRWTVLQRHGTGKDAKWLCRCDCGKEKVVYGGSLRKGATKSCGCLAAALTKVRNKRHGDIGTPEYNSWSSLKNRCLNSNSADFKDYGGRGIKVCDRWLGDDGYLNFLADMGRRPTLKHSIDRWPNTNGDYEPSNCRWATSSEQTRNYRRNIFHTINEETLCLKDWCTRLGVSYQAVFGRISLGYTIDEALAKKPRSSPLRAAHFGGDVLALAEARRTRNRNSDRLRRERKMLGMKVEQLVEGHEAAA